MSIAHKEALAAGRRQGKAVRSYLEALESTKPKRGRKRTADSIRKRLEKIQIDFDEADALKRLELTQEKLDLLQELEQMDTQIDMSQLEEEFVAVAADYAARKGISYLAFRDIGVDASVLRRAGITRANTGNRN